MLTAGPVLAFDSVDQDGSQICISDNFPNDAEAVCQGITQNESRGLRTLGPSCLALRIPVKMRIQTGDFGNKMSKSQLLELAHTPSPHAL